MEHTGSVAVHAAAAGGGAEKVLGGHWLLTTAATPEKALDASEVNSSVRELEEEVSDAGRVPAH